jgi:FeS assembly SUF system protein
MTDHPTSTWHDTDHAADPATDGVTTPGQGGADAAGPLHDNIIAALRTIYDPEIPVNIYDLGLIYGLDIADDGRVDVRMTLTAPACPVAGTFPDTVSSRLYEVPGVSEVRVDLVWDPPWTMDRMTDEVKLQLGLL